MKTTQPNESLNFDEESVILEIFNAHEQLKSTVPQAAYTVKNDQNGRKTAYIGINGVSESLPDAISACLIVDSESHSTDNGVHIGFSILSQILIEAWKKATTQEVERIVIGGHSLGAGVAIAFALSSFFKNDVPEEFRRETTFYLYSIPPFVNIQGDPTVLSKVDDDLNKLDCTIVCRRHENDIIRMVSVLAPIIGAPIAYPPNINKVMDMFKTTEEESKIITEWSGVPEGITKEHRLRWIYGYLLYIRDGHVPELSLESFIESRQEELCSGIIASGIAYDADDEMPKRFSKDIRAGEPFQIQQNVLFMLAMVGVPPNINDMVRAAVQTGDYEELIAVFMRMSSILPMLASTGGQPFN